MNFSNANGTDSVWVGFQNLQLYVEIQPSKGNLTTMTASASVPLHEWRHVAFTLKSGIGYMYYNGVVQNNKLLDVPTKVIRNFNFIGQDSYKSSEYTADAIYDNLNLYNGALTADEVMTVYRTDGNLKDLRQKNFNHFLKI